MRSIIPAIAVLGLLASGAHAQTQGGPASPAGAADSPAVGTTPHTTPASPAIGTPAPSPGLGASSQAPTHNGTAPAAISTTSAASRTSAAPVPGANSFTESQAKGRIADRGFTDVSGLTKDKDGVWRGTATKDGKQVHVALDYQGNVVTQ